MLILCISSRCRIKSTIQLVCYKLVFWVKTEVTFIYEIIHTMHYHLEKYQSRYSTYVHNLILSGTTELAMKHYKSYWYIFSPSPFLFKVNLISEKATWKQTEAATTKRKQKAVWKMSLCKLLTVAALYKPGFCSW